MFRKNLRKISRILHKMEHKLALCREMINVATLDFHCHDIMRRRSLRYSNVATSTKEGKTKICNCRNIMSSLSSQTKAAIQCRNIAPIWLRHCLQWEELNCLNDATSPRHRGDIRISFNQWRHQLNVVKTSTKA